MKRLPWLQYCAVLYICVLCSPCIFATLYENNVWATTEAGFRNQFSGQLVDVGELKSVLAQVVHEQLKSLDMVGQVLRFVKLDSHLELLLQQITKVQETLTKLEAFSIGAETRLNDLKDQYKNTESRIAELDGRMTLLYNQMDKGMTDLRNVIDGLSERVITASAQTAAFSDNWKDIRMQVDLLDESADQLSAQIKLMHNDVQRMSESQKELGPRFQTSVDSLLSAITVSRSQSVAAISNTANVLSEQLELLTVESVVAAQSLNQLVNLTMRQAGVQQTNVAKTSGQANNDVLEDRESTVRPPDFEAEVLKLEKAVNVSELKQHIKDVCAVKDNQLPYSCAEVQRAGHNTSGIYTVNPISCRKGYKVKVYCDLETDGGGWTVIQKRDDVLPQINFYRDWNEYKWGFGDLQKEFWLGLEPIHMFTSREDTSLRIDMEDFEGEKRYALYRNFEVSDERSRYRLLASKYSGNAGDSLSYHSGMDFSTKDQDHDAHHGGSCAVMYNGAWWHRSCHKANLNGAYYRGPHESYADGINWKEWRGYHYSLKRTEMKIRPGNFEASLF